MNLADWQARIERLHPQEIELGLGRIRAVAERLEIIHFACPVITVAGTNGKGSTVTLIERLARASGRRTGLYTSPHLHRFNERVRLDGDPASEFTTLAALCVFQQSALDLVILEVGLGGRLDAVNLIDADIALITSIGLDHQDWLGDDREQIGREKAGILRAGRPLLFASTEMPDSIAAAAQQGDARLLRAGEVFGTDGVTIYWQQSGRHELPVSDPVPLGRDNLAGAVQALALLDMLPEDIAGVAHSTALPGRCQHRRIDGCDWYFDVGHNREALQRFLGLLPAVAGRRRAVCAMLADKPAGQVMMDFMAHVDDWYMAGLGGSRGRSAEALLALLPDSTTKQGFATVAEAVAAVRARQSPGDQVLVFGSFHTVAEAAAALAVEL